MELFVLDALLVELDESGYVFVLAEGDAIEESNHVSLVGVVVVKEVFLLHLTVPVPLLEGFNVLLFDLLVDVPVVLVSSLEGGLVELSPTERS